MSNAAGLGALGFWVFLASIIVAGIWYDVRRRESQQETLRRIVESGQSVDPAMVDRIIGARDGENLVKGLKVSALIVLCAAPGLVFLALFLGQIAAEARSALLGTAGLFGFVGIGLWVSARLVGRGSDG